MVLESGGRSKEKRRLLRREFINSNPNSPKSWSASQTKLSGGGRCEPSSVNGGTLGEVDLRELERGKQNMQARPSVSICDWTSGRTWPGCYSAACCAGTHWPLLEPSVA